MKQRDNKSEFSEPTAVKYKRKKERKKKNNNINSVVSDTEISFSIQLRNWIP